MFSWVQALPSPASAEGEPSLFGWFTGTMAWSDSSRAYMSGVRLCIFPDRSGSRPKPDTREVSRFSCILFLSVRGFSDYAGLAGCSRLTQPAMWPSSSSGESRHPDQPVFRSSMAPPTDPSIYASTSPSRDEPQDSRPRWIRFLLSGRTLSFPTICRFYPGAPCVTGNPETVDGLTKGNATESCQFETSLSCLQEGNDAHLLRRFHVRHETDRPERHPEFFGPRVL